VSRDSSTSRLDAAVVAQIKANADLSAIGDNDVKIEASLLSKLCEMLLEPPYTVSESGKDNRGDQADPATGGSSPGDPRPSSSDKNERVSTHWAGCGMAGERHYECLKREHREAMAYALRLAEAIHAQHYSEVTDWKPLDTTIGLLTQIDNMVSGLTRSAELSVPENEADWVYAFDAKMALSEAISERNQEKYQAALTRLIPSHEQPIDIEERIRWHKSEARRLTLESIRGGQPSDIGEQV
jgi:hypothetical protein